MNKCKYCNKMDKVANMHCDKYTKEYYHEACRPFLMSERINFTRFTR